MPVRRPGLTMALRDMKAGKCDQVVWECSIKVANATAGKVLGAGEYHCIDSSAAGRVRTTIRPGPNPNGRGGCIRVKTPLQGPQIWDLWTTRFEPFREEEI